MRYNLCKTKIMPDGWHYPINGHIVRSDLSWEDLVQKCIDYKIQNGLPVGDIENEMIKWVCETYPHQCNTINPNFDAPAIVNDTQAYLDSITTWGQIKSKTNGKLVDQLTATQRAATCEQCFNNKIWDKTGCKSCIANIQRIMVSIRQNKDVMQAQELGGCTILKHDNRTAVWLENNNTADNLPGHCWCRK